MPHIDHIDRARCFGGLFAAGREPAITAVQRLNLRSGSNEHYALARTNASCIAKEERMPALFANGFHGDRESFLLIAVHNSAFEHIDTLSFRRSACRNEHLLGDIECLNFA